jgi:glycosyltransferase involved in cell wall biosynthesis
MKSAGLSNLCASAPPDYPEFEVIVTNDGSKDGTLAQLAEHLN